MNQAESQKLKSLIHAEPTNALNKNNWPEPIHIEDSMNKALMTPSLARAERNDILTDLASFICKEVQFPMSTGFLHGLGVIASAMNRTFDIEAYPGKLIPANLYVVTSQPASSGKSAVNDCFSDTVAMAFRELNKKNAPERLRLSTKIKAMEKDIEKAGENETDLFKDLIDLKEKLMKVAQFKYKVTNATPQGLEKRAGMQGGVWQLVSDEAGSINSTLGLTYGDSSKPTESDIVLQGWDGNDMSVERVGREGYEGKVRGSIAVIAQRKTMTSIFASGESGSGISERFLLLDEPPLMGDRSFIDENGEAIAINPIPAPLMMRYARLISAIVNSEGCVFTFSKGARNMIAAEKQRIEPTLREGGENSNTMIRGALGKMDKQVFKISAVLHVAEKWDNDKKSRPTVISDSTVEYAIDLFSQLTACYKVAADNQGLMGKKSEASDVSDAMCRILIPTKRGVRPSFFTSTKKLRSNLKGRGAFKMMDSLTAKYLSDLIVPILEKANHCINVDGVIYINPKLTGAG